MSHEQFKVKPVASYDEARYFAAPTDDSEPATEEKLHPLSLFILLLLVAGISIGLIGCYMRSEYSPGDPPPDAGPDSDPPLPPDCEDGLIRCVDDLTIATCVAEEWQERSCEEVCNETYGIDAYSEGCDASSDNPCRCEYDIIDGDYDPCYPNDLYCVDEDTLFICADEWREVECAEYCVETHGEGYVPGEVCDANQEDPCGCYYDMLDGVVAPCEPGDVQCIDDWNVQVCRDDHSFETRTCNDHCRETFGPDYYATGCSGDAENPCGCEYGMIDGEMVECSPEDVLCDDAETLRVCEYEMWQLIDCPSACRDALGEEAISLGCDADAEDPCRCTTGERK